MSKFFSITSNEIINCSEYKKFIKVDDLTIHTVDKNNKVHEYTYGTPVAANTVYVRLFRTLVTLK